MTDVLVVVPSFVRVRSKIGQGVEREKDGVQVRMRIIPQESEVMIRVRARQDRIG